jgi:hypothetical protein
LLLSHPSYHNIVTSPVLQSFTNNHGMAFLPD